MTSTSPTKTPLTDPAAVLDDDHSVEELLRADAAAWRDAYVHNDGFSDRIMRQIA